LNSPAGINRFAFQCDYFAGPFDDRRPPVAPPKLSSAIRTGCAARM